MGRIKDLIRKKNYRVDIILKILFSIFAILFIMPSLIYLIQNKTVFNFNEHYNFLISDKFSKEISTLMYLVIFLAMTAIYIIFVKNIKIFKNIKQVLIYTGIISAIFLIMLPFTSSDIFYYMGVGELNSVYGQNPYYVTMKEYCEENINDEENNDTIIKKAKDNCWSNTTVVYGPVAQMIFSICSKISFKNIDICILVFKLVNLIFHILNCYLIYKITKKLKFVIIYGLNPFMFLEFIGNVHNDIILVGFTLLSLYYLLNKKNLTISVLFLALATGIKYFPILLLPIIILYHYRDEKDLLKRFIKCIQYGLFFVAILALEYLVYYRDTSILRAMLVQTDRYSCSIYSGIIAIGKYVDVKLDLGMISKNIRNIVFLTFTILYVKFCIDLLTTKNIEFNKNIKKYNILLILFMLSLTNFHQWYLIWLFITLMWQKSAMINNVIGLTISSEVANSIYMFKRESWIYDMQLIIIMVLVFLIWKVVSNNKFLRKIRRLEN